MTYGVLNGLDYILEAARQRQLRVLAIIWLDWDKTKPTAAYAGALSTPSIQRGIELARMYPDTVIGISCGSEFLARNRSAGAVAELESVIRGCIAQVRRAGVIQPITSIDTWWEWCRATWPCAVRNLASEVDWIGINVFPWWENKFSGLFPCTPASMAADFTLARRNNVSSTYDNSPYGHREVIVTEFGWPRRGKQGEGYTEGCGVATESNHALVIDQTVQRLDGAAVSGNIFEAFQENWKERLEGEIGPWAGTIPVTGDWNGDGKAKAGGSVLGTPRTLPSGHVHQRLLVS